MSEALTESAYEQSLIELFVERLGYAHIRGSEVERDVTEPYCEEALREALERLNPNLPESALEEAFRRVTSIDDGSLVDRNRRFTDYLQNGVEISYRVDGEERGDIAYLADFQDADKNDFTIVDQWTYSERQIKRRADLLIFLNGLPIAIFELKSPVRETTSVSDAYLQLRNYMQDVPGLFVYNQICVASDLVVSKAGTITSGEDRYMSWKSVDGERPGKLVSPFVLFEGIFEKTRLLDLLKNFICFSEEGVSASKILAGYHQYFAVNKALGKVEQATRTDKRGGVFWHTQGSGKSLSMVFFAHGIQRRLKNPTIVVLTDRNDLDDQLFGQFSRCKNFLRETPMQAESRDHLRQLLDGRAAGGIVFTTMQKFEEYDRPLSERNDIVVMADEAHRSQYGLQEKNVVRRKGDGSVELRRSIGAARLIRDSLPNATFIGFTGTPVSSKDHNTREVFGEYIDVYDMTQAVEDEATKPVYYESRVVKLGLDEDVLKKIDQTYDEMAALTEPWIVEKSKRELGSLDQLLGNDQTLDALVNDIIDHYEKYRQNELAGKAMIVAYSRQIAVKLYRRILAMRNDWKDKIAVVMTGSNQDPEDWKKIVGGKAQKEERARLFKDPGSPLKIAIVVDMWLTGFDVPSLSTMYVFKLMTGHNLMQAIARVNRVYKDKAGGLIVDYVGIMSALKAAMREYTDRDRNAADAMDIAKQAREEFQTKLEVCRDMLYGFDYSDYTSDSQYVLTTLTWNAVNLILEKDAKEAQETELEEPDRIRARFIREAGALKQAYSLCSSIATRDERLQQAFFEGMRGLLKKIAGEGDGSERKYNLKEINKQIAELLRSAVLSEGVVNLFKEESMNFSLFDPKFIEEISKLKERNIAIELLKRLMQGQIKEYKKTNVVKTKKFSEQFQETLNRYLNGLLTNETVIEELLALAHAIAQSNQEGKALGLSEEEQAFYDAITQPEAVKDFYSNETLIQMTRELTDTLRKNRTIDWEKKESARAKMRVAVKKLLKKYKYPPEKLPEALAVVLEQCENWVDNTEF